MEDRAKNQDQNHALILMFKSVFRENEDGIRGLVGPLGGGRSMLLKKLSETQEASERQDWIRAFSKLPSDVRPEAFRAGLLPESVWQAFLLQPTPFAKEFWILEVEGRCLGRVGASLSPVRPGTGAIGFFEVDVRHPEAQRMGCELLEVASAWLTSQGVTVAHGPMNFNTWFPYRFRIEEGTQSQTHPDDAIHFGWEPVNPPEYVEIFARAGFQPLEVYHSQGHEGLAAFAAATQPAYERALGRGFQFRMFDSQRVMETEVPALYEVSMQGFKDNFLFEPIPFEAFRSLYVPIAGKLDLSLSHLALSPEGKPLAFFFCFEDHGYVVYKSVAVSPEARGQGLSNAVAYLAAEAGVKRGLTKMITALVKTGAQSESYAKKVQLLWEHKYALFSKTLA